MKPRHVLAVLGLALLATPVVLSIGTYFMLLLVPATLLLLPVLLVLGVAAVPALLLSSTHPDETAGPHASLQMSRTAGGHA